MWGKARGSFILLNRALAPVAVEAQHLAVGGAGFAAFAPGGDVVGFHLGLFAVG